MEDLKREWKSLEVHNNDSTILEKLTDYQFNVCSVYSDRIMRVHIFDSETAVISRAKYLIDRGFGVIVLYANRSLLKQPAFMLWSNLKELTIERLLEVKNDKLLYNNKLNETPLNIYDLTEDTVEDYKDLLPKSRVDLCKNLDSLMDPQKDKHNVYDVVTTTKGKTTLFLNTIISDEDGVILNEGYVKLRNTLSFEYAELLPQFIDKAVIRSLESYLSSVVPIKKWSIMSRVLWRKSVRTTAPYGHTYSVTVIASDNMSFSGLSIINTKVGATVDTNILDNISDTVVIEPKLLTYASSFENKHFTETVKGIVTLVETSIKERDIKEAVKASIAKSKLEENVSKALSKDTDNNVNKDSSISHYIRINSRQTSVTYPIPSKGKFGVTNPINDVKILDNFRSKVAKYTDKYFLRSTLDGLPRGVLHQYERINFKLEEVESVSEESLTVLETRKTLVEYQFYIHKGRTLEVRD